MAAIPALVEPTMLRWARQTQGYSVLAAARKIGIDEDKLAACEAGYERLTIEQLRKAAKAYRRSLAVFFLDTPPEGIDTLRDFRRVAGSESGEWSPELHTEFRRAQQQRDWLIDLLESEDTPVPTAWSLPSSEVARLSDAQLASRIRSHLEGLAGSSGPTTSDRYAHSSFWVSTLEDSGVLVLHTSGGGVATQEMRAMSLYFDRVPVIVLNGSDAVRARTFSLVHEYVHLLLHADGLCDMVTTTRATNPNTALEARCNAVAAEVLMPAAAVRAATESLRGRPVDEWTYERIASAAVRFGTSAEALLLRLVNLGLASRSLYEQRREDFQRAYVEQERSAATGGDFYRTKARDIGKGYVRRVAGAHRRKVIDSFTAATYLDVKVGQITRLAEAAGFASASGR
ncbi:XRE family transcriptional regulator [Cellulomonas pakistanensis]|nr:XRE family transcriptional regulator [Cellulomonas pakistanensis]